MQVLYLSFVFLFGAVTCIRHCEIFQCFPDVEFDFYHLPNEERLHMLCPDILKGLECTDEKMLSCTGSNLRELAKSSNVTIAQFAEDMISVGDFFADLCFEDSNLHEAYVQSYACVSEYFSSPKSTCNALEQATYEAYKELLSELPEEQKLSLPSPDNRCLGEAYYLYCVAKQIKTKCGEPGRYLFESMILRTNTFAVEDCRKEDLEDIKRKFLESLDVTGERKDYFLEAFEAIMKRK